MLTLGQHLLRFMPTPCTLDNNSTTDEFSVDLTDVEVVGRHAAKLFDAALLVCKLTGEGIDSVFALGGPALEHDAQLL